MVELGRGKDGSCYYDQGHVYKKLSDFGIAYHPITHYLISYLGEVGFRSSSFIEIQLTPSSYFYKAEPYLKIKLEEVQEYLRDYCRLQSKLLTLGIGITDLGLGLDKLNFMKDKTGSFKWVDYGGIGFSFDRRHAVVHNDLLPSILAQFEGIERRGTANILDSRLMMLFFCHQLDAIFSKKPTQEIMSSLWKIKLNELFLEDEFQKYQPACNLTLMICRLFRSRNWVNEQTWLDLEKILNL